MTEVENDTKKCKLSNCISQLKQRGSTHTHTHTHTTRTHAYIHTHVDLYNVLQTAASEISIAAEAV